MVRFSKLARSCAFAAPRKAIAHRVMCGDSVFYLHQRCPPETLRQNSNYTETDEPGPIGLGQMVC